MALPSSPGDHVLIIGGGIAGLLAARVLTRYFGQVTLVERDRYPEEPAFRPGVPQGRHVHSLLLRGQHIIEELFPGITQKLLARGAVKMHFTYDFLSRFPTGWLPRVASSIEGYTCSRILLEWQIRQELLAHHPIHIIEEHEVTDLIASSDAERVTGVHLRKRGGNSSTAQEFTTLSADLVIDASGRTSHASQWLEKLGYEPPEEVVINAFLGYSTRIYAMPDIKRDWKALLIRGTGNKRRAGMIWPIEGNRWQVFLGGAGKDYPPTHDPDFLEFARNLADSAVYEAIKDAQPLSPPYGYRRTENRLLHFERLTRQPDGFIVIGDATCTFNPVYGQGMTVAALDAQTLDHCLSKENRSDLSGFPGRFQKRLATIKAFPWQLASSADFRVPGAESNVTNLAPTRIQRYYNDVTAILPISPLAYRTFAEIQHMVKSPAALFHPAIMWKVFSHRRQKLRRSHSPEIRHPQQK